MATKKKAKKATKAKGKAKAKPVLSPLSAAPDASSVRARGKAK